MASGALCGSVLNPTQHRQASGAFASTSSAGAGLSLGSSRHAAPRPWQQRSAALLRQPLGRHAQLRVLACSVKGKRDPPKPVRKPSPKSNKGGGLSRVSDGALLLGDLVMLTATEVSSERIAFEDMPLLLAVVVGCWTAAAVALEDYNGEPPSSYNWYLGMLGTPFLAVINATVTWASSVTLMLVVYSALVANHTLDDAPILEGLGTDDLSPQMEIVIATLITMACWRGIAAKVRFPY